MFDDYDEQQGKSAKQARLSKQQQQQQPSSRPKPSAENSSEAGTSKEAAGNRGDGGRRSAVEVAAIADYCCCLASGMPDLCSHMYAGQVHAELTTEVLPHPHHSGVCTCLLINSKYRAVFHHVAVANAAERLTSHAAASAPADAPAAALSKSQRKKHKAAAAAAAAAAVAAVAVPPVGDSKLDAFLSKRKGLNSRKVAQAPSQAQIQAQQQQQEQQRLLERQLKKQFMSCKVRYIVICHSTARLHDAG
jgi:hypothetical protein